VTNRSAKGRLRPALRERNVLKGYSINVTPKGKTVSGQGKEL
jgi:hypothetical protein